MARIDIRRKHSYTLKDAKKAVDALAKKLAKEHSLDCAWQDNTLEFSRSGVKGHIALTKGEIHVFAELGFLMGMLKPQIEAEINEYLDEHID